MILTWVVSRYLTGLYACLTHFNDASAVRYYLECSIETIIAILVVRLKSRSRSFLELRRPGPGLLCSPYLVCVACDLRGSHDLHQTWTSWVADCVQHGLKSHNTCKATFPGMRLCYHDTRFETTWTSLAVMKIDVSILIGGSSQTPERIDQVVSWSQPHLQGLSRRIYL